MKDEPNREASRLCSVIPGVLVALAVGALIAAAFHVRPPHNHRPHEAETVSALHFDAVLRSGEFLPARP